VKHKSSTRAARRHCWQWSGVWQMRKYWTLCWYQRWF